MQKVAKELLGMLSWPGIAARLAAAEVAVGPLSSELLFSLVVVLLLLLRQCLFDVYVKMCTCPPGGCLSQFEGIQLVVVAAANASCWPQRTEACARRCCHAVCAAQVATWQRCTPWAQQVVVAQPVSAAAAVAVCRHHQPHHHQQQQQLVVLVQAVGCWTGRC